MSHTDPHRDGWRDHPSVLHEKRDIDWRIILGTAAALIIAAGVIHYVCYVGFWYFRGRADRINAEIARAQPLAAQENRRDKEERILSVPPPRLEGLQPTPGADYTNVSRDPARVWSPRVRPAELNAEYQKRLQGYGWVDRRQGIAHIPIDRAMAILVQSHQLDPTGEKKP